MAYTEGDILENESGERVQLTAEGWQPLQAQPGDSDVPMVGQPEQYQDPTAPSRTDWKNFGGVTWPGNSPLDMLGAINPSFAGATGVAQAIGGTATRLGAAAPRAGGVVGRLVQGVQDTAAMLPESQIAQRMGIQPQGARMAAQQGDTVAGRVMGAIDGATPKTRKFEGLYSPQEMEALTGVKLTAGQGDELSVLADDAAGIRRAELRRSWEDTVGQSGGLASDAWNQQRNALRGALDTAVRQRTGIQEGVALNDNVIGAKLTEVGNEIGELGRQAGWVKFEPDEIKAMTDMAEANVSSVKGPLTGVIKDIERFQSEGQMSGEQYQKLYTKVNNMAQTKELMDSGGKLLKMMEEGLQRQLPDAAQQALRDARYKYRILKRLKKPGVVGVDGSINPRSFRRSWNKGTSDKLQGSDELGKLSETVDMLVSPRAHTGNTLQRFISAAPGAAQNSAGATITGGIGAGMALVAQSLFND